MSICKITYYNNIKAQQTLSFNAFTVRYKLTDGCFRRQKLSIQYMSQDDSYLAAFFLPEDSWWRISFGATEEGYCATRRCDLVSRPNHNLRGHWHTQNRDARLAGWSRNKVFVSVCVVSVLHTENAPTATGQEWWQRVTTNSCLT